MGLKNGLKIIGEIFNITIFILLCCFFWYILTVFAPNYRFIVIIFGICYLIFKFPKQLFIILLAQALILKAFISKIIFQDDSDAESYEENQSEDPEDNEDDSDTSLSIWQQYLYKGSIAVSLVFIALIIYQYSNNQSQSKQAEEYALKHTNINISMDPIQYTGEELTSFTKTVNNKDYNIKELASYKIAGIVVAKNTFLIFDPMNELSPVDIGLVWGDLAKTENYKKMGFSSNFRLLTYSAPNGFPLSSEFITTHSSHNHIIPADDKIKNFIMNLSNDDKIALEGYLVEVTTKGINPWTSSLRRDDHLFNSGRGCEIFYVEKATKI